MGSAPGRPSVQGNDDSWEPQNCSNLISPTPGTATAAMCDGGGKESRETTGDDKVMIFPPDAQRLSSPPPPVGTNPSLDIAAVPDRPASPGVGPDGCGFAPLRIDVQLAVSAGLPTCGYEDTPASETPIEELVGNIAVGASVTVCDAQQLRRLWNGSWAQEYEGFAGKRGTVARMSGRCAFVRFCSGLDGPLRHYLGQSFRCNALSRCA
eukprot:TRINITY_DN9398_c0_g1_i1.p1 TRINITY_DN9398_c0_g1~~TRINITY_DN9398_c0_g1_i1.p1  ORF type:complete len:209 (+),score=32.92 TRINITY_DN9398_c0_g1_i1:315-941(+)